MIVDLRPALVGYLLADTAISTALVTVNGRYRIFPLQLPPGVTITSAIVYTRVSGLGDHTMDGASGLTQTRMQIDAWASTHETAATLANLVKKRIDGVRGRWSSPDSPPAYQPVDVQGVFFDSEREDYDNAAKLYRVGRDYLIWYSER